ncbi:MAG: hypothetical protein J7562_12730 [Agrobacterium tumefaciens]|nr:hypothetical protein [Agrobacterium tumefaciens]
MTTGYIVVTTGSRRKGTRSQISRYPFHPALLRSINRKIHFMTFKAQMAMFVSVFILSGCMTEADFNRGQEVISGSPAAKRDVINSCYKETRNNPADARIVLAKTMNVSPNSNVAMTFCSRLFNAIASKKITYADFANKSPAFIRAIQGR